MKYTFRENGKATTIEIDDKWLIETRKAQNLSTKQAVALYIQENAKEVGLPSETKLSAAPKKPAAKKTRARKEDPEKRELIEGLNAYLSSLGQTDSVEVMNAEREIMFSVGDNTYTLTVARKRKPKA